MDVSIGNKISGIDIYGKSIKGEITGISNAFRIATVKTGKDRLDITTVSFDDINK